VVMTPAAKEFITPVTLSALSGRPVVSEFFTANTGEWHSHVDLGLWADAMVIAPATACTIAKMANGVADNMLVTTYLSAREPVFVAPAMDLDMMAHPTTRRNLELLKSYGNHIIEPAEGELASHLIGKGRMEEPENILAYVEAYFARLKDSPLKGKKVLVTAGPTRERIDPVRYISNYSTGKMGFAIADEAARRGADVTVVAGPTDVRPKEHTVRVIDVESAREMLASAREHFADADIAVWCAAVADYHVANESGVKIKREGNRPPELVLVPNPDIAATLGAEKRPGQFLVGFALETDHESTNAVSKLARKHLDMIVMNSLRDPGAGFATDTNKISIYLAGHESEPIHGCTKPKTEVAADILDVVCSQLAERQ
ncbi:MAG: bifunctional phosphopantothenoylcysteine decarboxylase/phosphopantothenate--cysteine ligase CoaBC, partial [Muribaculaceae bacterium]|nr:bifunctional phosphopantothenoylcysteine decarboxylase/phosphopantothenate--cysteine ligase CoaBC [Muribaculaceae bacterium]